MVYANITIAIIILVLFTVLALVGFGIWYADIGFSRMGRRVKGEADEEDGSRSSGSSGRSRSRR